MKRSHKTWLARGLCATALLVLAGLLFLLARGLYYHYHPERRPVTSEMCVVAVWQDTGTLLAVYTGGSGELCSLPAQACTLQDQAGAGLTLADFSSGDVVLVSGRNEVLYSWPLGWPSASRIVRTGRTDPELAAAALQQYEYVANAAGQQAAASG